MRKRIVEIIEPGSKIDNISRIYDWFMITCIILSLVPLIFKTETEPLILLERITVTIFIIEYIIRWATADLTSHKSTKLKAYLFYPLTPMAIIDLLSILPSISVISRGFKVLRVLRAFKAIKVLKIIRYSKSVKRISNVFLKQKDALMAVVVIAVLYVFISALVVFSVEPDAFENFFESIYWSVISLTPMVGYGDIVPLSTAGRIVTMSSALFGLAIIALPAGIITGGYIEELEDEKDNALVDKI
ncbi:MAG: ion transporter [Peptostreptococcaceae bacterium]|nr:ion transporter [Peptostreptococcaceae bacterium]